MNLKMINRRRLAALAAVLFIAAGCGRKSSVLLEQPLRNVVMVESNAQTLMALAEAGARADVLLHIDGTDDMAVFSPSLQETIKNTADHLKRKNYEVVGRIAPIIENGGAVNIGARAGMYERVIWVIPTHGPVTDLPLESFKRALAGKRGFPVGELEDFVVSGRHINGTIGGVPLTVTSLDDLDTAGETAILDIDLTYFTALQATSADYLPGTAALLDFLDTLKRKGIPAVMATVNRSSVNQGAPLDIRYYADVIGEVLADPALIEDPPDEKYGLMIQAEKALAGGQYGEAAALYAGLVENHPREAGLHFSHALALGFLDNGEECRDAMISAYGIDTAYMRGFFQLARVLGANGHVSAGEELLRTPDLEKTLNKVEMEYQWGLFYMQSGEYMRASEMLVNVASRRPRDFALRTVLYRAYAELDNEKKMYKILEALVELDRDRVVRDMPWAFKKLGDMAWGLRLDPIAADWYRQYLEVVPDDPDGDGMRELIEEWKDRRAPSPRPMD